MKCTMTNLKREITALFAVHAIVNMWSIFLHHKAVLEDLLFYNV